MVEQEDLEIVDLLKEMNICPGLEAEEPVEPSAVCEWDDGVVVRAFPVPPPSLEEFEFGGMLGSSTEWFEVEQGTASGAGDHGEE